MRLPERVEWVASRVGGKDVLDVGCVGDFRRILTGRTHTCPEIIVRAKFVLGIDINREGVEVMRNLGYNVIYANAENFVSERKFDVVVLGACVEHMDNSGLVFDRAWENLREGGRVVITTPTARYLGFTFKEKAGRTHNFVFTPKFLSRMLKRHGFRVIEVQHFGEQGSTNLIGVLYRIFLRFFPQYSMHFGVVAEKVER
ncbi:MAG: class I SAM-dependent methyltransferase [Hadesarchaea archaeon]|nr:class I SAM-dependent methyltransferase [Hadesarchaea archaeon]